LIKRFGAVNTRDFIRVQQESVDHVANTIDRFGLKINPCGDGDVTLGCTNNRLKELRTEARFLNSIGIDAEFMNKEQLVANGMAGPKFLGGLKVNNGFAINPLEYCVQLANCVFESGAKIYHHSPVMDWKKKKGVHYLSTPEGLVIANKVVVATNGYGQEELTGSLKGKLMPVLSNILVTRPLTNIELIMQGWNSNSAAIEGRMIINYFRLLPDNRFLFGGRGGVVGSVKEKLVLKNQLRLEFGKLFPFWKDVNETHFWNGLACLSYNLTAHIGPCKEDSSVYYGLAYHGNGIALASWSGKQIAGLVAGEKKINIPAILAQPINKFPFHFLRKLYLRGAYMSYHLKESLQDIAG